MSENSLQELLDKLAEALQPVLEEALVEIEETE